MLRAVTPCGHAGSFGVLDVVDDAPTASWWEGIGAVLPLSAILGFGPAVAPLVLEIPPQLAVRVGLEVVWSSDVLGS